MSAPAGLSELRFSLRERHPPHMRPHGALESRRAGQQDLSSSRPTPTPIPSSSDRPETGLSGLICAGTAHPAGLSVALSLPAGQQQQQQQQGSEKAVRGDPPPPPSPLSHHHPGDSSESHIGEEALRDYRAMVIERAFEWWELRYACSLSRENRRVFFNPDALHHHHDRRRRHDDYHTAAVACQPDPALDLDQNNPGWGSPPQGQGQG